MLQECNVLSIVVALACCVGLEYTLDSRRFKAFQASPCCVVLTTLQCNAGRNMLTSYVHACRQSHVVFRVVFQVFTQVRPMSKTARHLLNRR